MRRASSDGGGATATTRVVAAVARSGASPRRGAVAARRLAVALLAFVAGTGPARAADWRLVARSADGLVAFYVDASAAKRSGGTWRVPLLYDYRSAQVDPDTQASMRSMVALTAFDCRVRRFVGVEATGYAEAMGRGKVVSRVAPAPDAPPQPVTPKSGSVDAQVFDYVCSRVAPRG